LFSNFADTLIDNFLPSISKILIKPPLKWIKHYIRCPKDSSVITKGATFIVRVLATIPLKIIQVFVWLIETSIKKFVKSLIKNLGPTIVNSTVENLQAPRTQMIIEESLLEVLKTLKTSLMTPSPEPAKAAPAEATPPAEPRFSAKKNLELNLHLRNLAKSLAAMLALKAPKMPIKPDRFLERIIQSNPFGESPIDLVFSEALVALIPEASMSAMSELLHPEKITNLVASLIDIVANSFSPSEDKLSDVEEIKRKETQETTRQVIRYISTLAIQTAMKEAVEHQLLPHLPETVEFPTIPRPADADMIDLEAEVKHSFVPRVYKYIATGVSCVFDENIERYGMISVLNLLR
jgi:hypothetical protein